MHTFLLQLWDIFRRLMVLPRDKYLVIRGNVGSGKSWLAMGVCLDFTIIRQMDFHIFWLDVLKCDTPREILDMMRKLAIMLDKNSIFTSFSLSENETDELKIAAFKKAFQKTFDEPKYKNALLVLCNVRNRRVLDAFNFHCKTLITTRNESHLDDIAKERLEVVVIDRGFTVDESLEVFRKLRVFQSSGYRTKVRQIHKLCKGAPRIITFISNNLAGRWNPEQQLGSFVEQLKRNELNDVQLRTMIEESLKVLSADEKEAYQRLVIFQDHSYIPIAVLQRYWQKNASETDKLVDMLYKYSMISLDKSGEAKVTIDFIYWSYLNNLYSAAEKKRFHSDLIQAYNIEKMLRDRSEPDLIDLANDDYIHFYMAYHLKEAGYEHLFPKLFLDFGFLEQKLRFTGLTNTLGDLSCYRNEIVNGDSRKARLLEELVQFLPSIEEMIYKTTDTSLLQYCLNARGIVFEEAESQAKRFRDRAWFNDIDHSHKRRQIVKFHARPVRFKFHDPDVILVALADNTIMLTDLSPSYSAEPTSFHGHQAEVKHISTFGNHILTLDVNGVVLVWTLDGTSVHNSEYFLNERNRQVMQDVNRHLVRNLNIRRHIQKIESSKMNPITCFAMHNRDAGRPALLYCATKSGVIIPYEWCQNTKQFSKQVVVDSGVTNIECMHYLPEKYLMFLTRDGHLSFYDLNTTAKKRFPFSKEWHRTKKPLAIYQTKPNVMMCVFGEKIVKIEVISIHSTYINIEPFQDIFPINKATRGHGATQITCSSLSEDCKYLILGTEKGIIVFDCDRGVEQLRNSVGDRISCIDICTSSDTIYKYIVISATEQSVGNIYALKLNHHAPDSVMWASSNTRWLSDENLAHISDNSWLIGADQFEVLLTEEDDECRLYAVDSQNRIHLYTSQNQFATSQTVSGRFPHTIIVTGTWKGSFYFGCADGKLYKFGESKAALDFGGQAIVYLKEVNGHLVVGTATEYRVLGTDLSGCGAQILDCFAVDTTAILFVMRSSPVKNKLIFVQYLHADSRCPNGIPAGDCTDAKEADITYIGCDFKNGVLAVADSRQRIAFYLIGATFEDITLHETETKKQIVFKQDRITALALSTDADMIAVGLETGDIRVSIVAI